MSMTVGIDFGTIDCHVAVSADAEIPNKARLIETGRLVPRGGVLLIADSDLALSIPSAVWVGPDGTTLVGAAARRKAGVAGAPPAMFFKRLLGTDQLVRAGHTELTAVHASTLLLRHLKQTAEAALGVTVDRAVIAFPVSFEAKARARLAEAGRHAGFDVADTLAEPLAAALAAHHLDENPVSHRVLVYDLGGGTFGASVVRWDPDQSFTIESFDGYRYLDGHDFDQVIVDWIVENLPDYDLTAKPGNPGDSERHARLLWLAERAKHDLSRESEAEIVDDSIEDRSGRRISIDMTIRRIDFEAKIGEYLRGTLALCDSAVRRSGAVAGKPDTIVLVGGSSRIPLVSMLLRQHFSTRIASFPPELMVVVGAALKGASLPVLGAMLKLEHPSLEVSGRQVPGWGLMRQHADKLEADWQRARREGPNAAVTEFEPQITQRLDVISLLLVQQRDPANAHHLLLETESLLRGIFQAQANELAFEPPPSRFQAELRFLRRRIEELTRRDEADAERFLSLLANLESEGAAAQHSGDLIRWRQVNRRLHDTYDEIMTVPFLRAESRMPAHKIKHALLGLTSDIDEAVDSRHLALQADSSLDPSERAFLPQQRDSFRDELARIRGAIVLVQADMSTARDELLRLYNRLSSLQRRVQAWGVEAGMWDPSQPATTGLLETGDDVPRYVNIVVTRRDEGSPMPRQVALAAAGQYRLRISIGDIDAASLIDRPALFPVDQLPVSEEGHWLSVGLSSGQLLVAADPVHLFLPRTGPAWVCACTPGIPAHRCTPTARSLFAYIPVTAPPVKTRARVRVGLYFGATIVQTFVLTLSVDTDEIAAEPATALCDYSLTPDLDDIAGLPRRDVSALADSDGGTHRLVITRLTGDGTTTTVVASVGDGGRTDLVRSVRAALLAMHVEDIEVGVIHKRRQMRNRYQENNSAATIEQFRADLRRLAALGRALWTGLFGTIVSGSDVMYEIARTAGLRIQIATPATSRFVFPWAVVYDIPLQSAPELFHDCPVLDTWDLTAQDTPLLPDGRCPYTDQHDIGTICPSGFWGYRHLIDQPVPAEGTRVTTVVSAGSATAAAVAGIGAAGLVPESVAAHLRTVELAIGRPLTQCGRTEDLRTALARDEVAVVYFFCHGRWHPGPTGSIESRLELDEGQMVAAGDLFAWKQVWGHHHWATGGPLVFVNGCHTLDVTPDSVTDLVAGFSRIGASGVIGTETTVHQNLAAEAGEIFWRALAVDRSSAGDSLRHLRHSLLAKGNLLGLAYTAYCATELRIL